MHGHHLPTGNPALIAQRDKVRHAQARNYASLLFGDLSANTQHTALTAATFVATTEHEAAARTQRALELLATQAGARDAHLFKRSWNDEPVLIGTLGSSGPSTYVLERVRAMFEALPEEDEETAFISASQLSVPVEPCRLLPLTLLHEQKRTLVGALALPGDGVGSAAKRLNFALLHDLTLQLFHGNNGVPRSA